MITDNFCFYLQNRLIQTSQTGGQWYNDTSPLVFPGLRLKLGKLRLGQMTQHLLHIEVPLAGDPTILLPDIYSIIYCAQSRTQKLSFFRFVADRSKKIKQ